MLTNVEWKISKIIVERDKIGLPNKIVKTTSYTANRMRSTINQNWTVSE